MKKIDSFAPKSINGLRDALQYEFKYHVKNGIYSYTQKKLAYSSNRIEGSTLSADQTALLFDTGTIYGDEVFRAKDVEEANGHFLMFNRMLATLDQPLTQELIKRFHWELKSGVFEDKANGYPIGEYKSRANIAGSEITVAPADVPAAMQELVQKPVQTFDDVLHFHSEFEHIHPFQDGNGRVGRIIMYRQCLQNDMIPIVVDDNKRTEYIVAIKASHQGKSQLLADLFRQFQDQYEKEIAPFLV